MGSSPGFGPAPRHWAPCSDSRSLRLRPSGLNLSDAEQLAGSFFNKHAVTYLKHAPTARERAVSGLGTPLPGYFSPFPHGTVRYRSPGVGRLGGWSPQLPAGFPVSRGTRARPPPRPWPFAYGAVTPSGPPSQAVRLRPAPISGHRQTPHDPPTTPAPQRLPPWHGTGLGLEPGSLTTTAGLAVACCSSGY